MPSYYALAFAFLARLALARFFNLCKYWADFLGIVRFLFVELFIPFLALLALARFRILWAFTFARLTK